MGANIIHMRVARPLRVAPCSTYQGSILMYMMIWGQAKGCVTVFSFRYGLRAVHVLTSRARRWRACMEGAIHLMLRQCAVWETEDQTVSVAWNGFCKTRSRHSARVSILHSLIGPRSVSAGPNKIRLRNHLWFSIRLLTQLPDYLPCLPTS